MDNHRRKPWYAQPLPRVCAALRTSPEGLCDAEAAERLNQNGPNELRGKPPKSLLHMLREQLLDPMVLILLGAALLSAILREWTEAIVIFTIVVVNAFIGLIA